ncbi:MAG: prephenate dehydrogenase [Anaerolineales bacterium]|nr:prephenate dehydrogenase [Anaerolineales bacterium]
MPDEDGFALTKATVAIVGLGLMGGSLALALRERCAGLLAVDPDPATLALARQHRIVDRIETDPHLVLPQADLIVLAAPVPAILDLLSQLDALVPQACVILDLGSSKAAIVEAMGRLPQRFAALGGHPICGREALSLANADPDLYHNAPFVLTPPAHISARASAAAFQVIAAIGAQPLWMDAALHDRILAATSHLPFLLASALVLATPPNSAPLVGPGFRSASRLASTPASMMLGVLCTNRENILASLARFGGLLDALEQALRDEDYRTAESLLDSAREKNTLFL